ncbi:hypothetical protein PPERSA_03680 [Pseudocohnilembus persalinus]|uniref:Uncharacterized protein n=1 Tax=Pseudocohnilembus persalinus TaxID=266149 RepID=A0A0V0QGA0_PSEPJ|nr:hypothetical protein PPERSA_03680 [Pseudocohnilembus persalinus]|eukprot:KRX01176.1 hypothetical protein PPERSA_03680 [Pseudocohnilembus persalinus]
MSKSSEISLNSLKSDSMAQITSINNAFLNKQYNNIQIKQESNYTSISPSPKRCRPSLTTTAKQNYRKQNININNKNNNINNNNKNNNINNKSNKFFQKSQQLTKSTKKSQNSYKQLHLKNLEYQQSHPKSQSLKSKKEIELEKYLLQIQKRYESPLEYRSQLYLQNTYKLQMEDEKEEKRNFFLQQKKKQEKIQHELDEKNKRRKNKNFQQEQLLKEQKNQNQNLNQKQNQDLNQFQSLNENQNSRKQLNQLAKNLVEQSPKKFQRNSKKLSQSFNENSSIIQSQNQSFQEMEQQKLEEILNDLKDSYKEKSETDQEVLSTVIQLIKMQHKIASVTAKKQNYLAQLLQNSQFSQNSQFIGQVEKLNKYIFNVLKKETDNYQTQQEKNINNKKQENLRYIQTTPDELTYNTLDSSQLDNYFNNDNYITIKNKNNKNNDINNCKKSFQKIQNNSTTNKSKTKIDFSQPLYNSMSPSQRGNLKNIIIQNNSIQINNNSQRQKRLSFEEVQKSQLDEFQDLEQQVNSTKHVNQVNLNNGSHFTQYQEQNQIYQDNVNNNLKYAKTQNEQKQQNIHPSQIVFEKSESGNTSQKDQNQYNQISNLNLNKLVKNSNQKNNSQNISDYPIFSNQNFQKQLQKQNSDLLQQQQNLDYPQQQQNLDYPQQQQNLDFHEQQQNLDFKQQKQQQYQQFRLQTFTPSKLKIKLHRSISLQDSERLGQKKVQKYKGLSEQHSIHEEEEDEQNKQFQNVPQDSVQQQQIMEKQQQQNEKLRNLLQEYEKSQNSQKKQLKQGILEQLQSISPNQYQHIDKYISDLELDNWEKDCQILDMQLRIDEVKQQQQTQNLRNFNYVQSSLSFDNKSIKKTNQLSKSNRIIGVQPFQVNKYSKSIQSFNSNTDSPMNSNFKNPICFSNQAQSNDEKKLEIQITESFNQSRILDMNENKQSEKNTITNNQLKRNYEYIQQEIENSSLTFENKLSNFKQLQNKQQNQEDQEEKEEEEEEEEQKLEIQQQKQQDYLQQQQQIIQQNDIKNLNFDGQNQVSNQKENSDFNKQEQSKSSQKQKNSLKKLDIFDSKSKLKKQFKEDLFQTNSNLENGYDNGGKNQSERTISEIKLKENINSIDKITDTDNFYPQSEELEQISQKNQDQSIEQQIYSEYKTQNQRLMDIFKQKLNKQYEIKLEELRQSSPTTQKKSQAQNQTQILQQLIENTQKNLQFNFEQNEQKLNNCSQQSLDLVNYNDINSILNKNNNNIDLIRQKVDNLKQSLTKIKSPKKEQTSHLYINTNIHNSDQQQQNNQQEQINFDQQQELNNYNYNQQQEQNNYNQQQQQKSELLQNPNQFYNKEEYRSKKQAFQIQSSNDLYSPIQQLELQNQLKLKYSQMEHDKDKQNNLEGKISPIIYQTGSKSSQKDYIINSPDIVENFQNDLSSQIQQRIQNSHQFQQLSSLKQSQTYFPTQFTQDKQNLSQNNINNYNNKNSVSVKNFFDYQENSGYQNKNQTMQQSPKFYYNSNCQSKSNEKDRQSEKETFQNLNSFSLNKDNQFVSEFPENSFKQNQCFLDNNQNQTQNCQYQNQLLQNQQQSQSNNLYSNKNRQNQDIKYSNIAENSNKKMNIPNININIQNNNSNQILNLPQNLFQQSSGQKNQEKSQSLLNFVKNQCQLAKNSTIGIYEKQMQIESQIESHTQSVNQSYALNSQQSLQVNNNNNNNQNNNYNNNQNPNLTLNASRQQQISKILY